MWFEWIAAFSLSFWIIVGVLAAALTTATEKEDFGWSTILAIVTLVVMQLFSDAQPFPWVFQHIGGVLIGIVGYAAAGGLWSIVKWWLFVLDAARDAAKWANKNPERPRVSSNKWRIVAWVIYWPASVLGTILNNFVSRIAHAVYDLLAKTYQRIVDNVWKQFDEPKAKAAPLPSGPDLSTGA